MDYKNLLLKAISDEKYYNNTDLRMNRNYSIMLSNSELDFLLKKKDFLS